MRQIGPFYLMTENKKGKGVQICLEIAELYYLGFLLVFEKELKTRENQNH